MDYLYEKQAKRDRFLRSVATILGVVLGLCSLGLMGVAISARNLGSLLHHAAFLALSAVVLILVYRNERLWDKLDIERRIRDEFEAR